MGSVISILLGRKLVRCIDSFWKEIIMDINNLLAFIEVADKRSFSRSAETLNLTQPAVSKRIAALESELSSRLFDRVGRTVHLTEAGKVLLPSALKINSEVSRIESEIYNLGKEVRGKLSIGVAEHVSVDRLALVLKVFREEYPEVDIDLQFTSSQETLIDVENGILDMGLCSIFGSRKEDKTHPRLRDLEVWNDKLKVVVEKNHPLAASELVSIAQLSSFPAILPKQYSTVRKSIDKIMIGNQVEALVSLEATDFPAIRTMASIGLGWACLPECEVDDSLLVLNVRELNINHSVALVRNPDRSMSRAAQAFVDTLPARLI